MRKFVVLAGGLGNQLFQIAGALSATDQVVHVITCLGNPKRHSGKLEVSSLDFLGRVQFAKCEKRHYVSPLAFRAMLSLATTKRDLPDKSTYRKALLLLSGTIFSVHLRTLVYPRISRGVGHDDKFGDTKGNLFIGYFQTHRIASSVKDLIINALDQIDSKELGLKKKSLKTLMHIRLGDYRSEPTFGVLNSEYFATALKLIEMDGPISEISVFSDEPETALKLLPLNYFGRIKLEENAGESPLKTLCRMRGYESYILANSTFSWWAAYTSSAKNVYVPDPWFMVGDSPVELVPESWMQIKRD